jgi:hypothetical protein
LQESQAQTDTNPAPKKRKRPHRQTLITDENLDGIGIADDDDEDINMDDYQTETGGVSFKECMEKLRKAANPRASDDEPDEEEGSRRLRPSLANLVNTFLQGLDAWSKEKDYDEDSKWTMAEIAMINTNEYKRLTRDFRKGNAFNAYEHYMHRNDKIPEQYRGRVESAKWLANTWKEMSDVEKAKFEGVKGKLQTRGSGDYRDHTAVSKKIIRRLNWTMALAESVGINAMGFVVDERYHRGTRFYGTNDGVRFTSILDFCGVGLPFFKAFVTENMQKKQMRDFVKPYYAERIRAYQAGETAELEVPPLVQAIMGKLHNQHLNPSTQAGGSTEAGGSADVDGSHSQVAIQKTFEQPRLGTKRVSTASHEDRRVMLTIA